jgi:hypothetical protein
MLPCLHLYIALCWCRMSEWSLPLSLNAAEVRVLKAALLVEIASLERHAREDVHSAFRAIEGHTMEGLITWCNNALGIVYLASAPGLPDVLACPF